MSRWTIYGQFIEIHQTSMTLRFKGSWRLLGRCSTFRGHVRSQKRFVRGGNDYTYCGVDLKPFLPVVRASDFASKKSFRPRNGGETHGFLEILLILCLQKASSEALALSTIVGAICMMLVQIPMLARFTWMPQVGRIAS